MKTKFRRLQDGFSSSERYRHLSDALEKEVCAQAIPMSLWDFLLRVQLLPFGQAGLESVIMNKLWKDDGDWLEIPTENLSILVWNVFRGYTAEHADPEAIQKREFLELLEMLVPSKVSGDLSPFKTVGKILEGGLASRFPRGLVTYSTGTLRWATPRAIDFQVSSGAISEETVKRSNVFRFFPTFFRTLVQLGRALDHQKEIDVKTLLSTAVERAKTALDREATSYLIKISDDVDFRIGIGSKSLTALKTQLRSMSSIASLLLHVRRPSKHFYYTDNHRAAATLLVEVAPELSSKIEETFANGTFRSSSLRTTLVSLSSVWTHFGLDQPYPEPSQPDRCARRVVLCVLSCGRRLSCLTGVMINDFIVDGDALFLRLGPTKRPDRGYFRLPLHALLPSSDTAFIRDWLGAIDVSERSELLFVACGVDPTLCRNNAFPAELHNEYADLLVEDCSLQKRPNLHDLRRMGLTWLAIRLALVGDRSLRNTPVLRPHLQHPLFEDKALDRLKREVAPHSGIDPLHIVATIAGHADRASTRRWYAFSMPILTALHAYKRWLSLRAVVRDQSMIKTIDALFDNAREAH